MTVRSRSTARRTDDPHALDLAERLLEHEGIGIAEALDCTGWLRPLETVPTASFG